MMVFLLGSNEEVAGGRHAGTSSGTDGGIRNAVRPPVDIHHLLFLIHYDQQLSGQRRIIFPLEQVPRNSSRFFKIPRHFFYRNMGRGDRGKLLPVVPQDENKNGTHRQETNGWKRDNFISISRITALDSWRPEKRTAF